ncbi:MAG: helix-hairpin-helix domain-containing protein, partial [Deltaproteobacteria bacterium]|nr:helix-hairpin-helix domain-containing protein [Deltaproteobacteria bacterium]
LYAGLQVNNVPNGDLVKQLAPATQSVVAKKVDVNKASRAELVRLPGVSPSIADQIIAARERQPLTDIGELKELPSLNETQRSVLTDAYGPLQGIEARATTNPHDNLYLFGTFSNVLLLLGLVAGLIYFYFSVAHKGAIGRVSRFGVWILMIGFGASFGFTVQGRISLAIGRAMDVLGQDKSPVVAEQIHGPLVAAVAIAVIVAGIIIWERRVSEPEPSGSDEE